MLQEKKNGLSSGKGGGVKGLIFRHLWGERWGKKGKPRWGKKGGKGPWVLLKKKGELKLLKYG